MTTDQLPVECSCGCGEAAPAGSRWAPGHFDRMLNALKSAKPLEHVTKVVRRRGLSDAHQKRLERMIELRKEKKSFEYIAAEFSITPERVRQILLKWGAHDPRPHQDFLPRVREFYPTALGISQLSKRVGVAMETVYRLLQYDGITVDAAHAHFAEVRAELKRLQRMAASLERIPTVADVKKWGDHYGVNLEAITGRYGTLKNAIAAAGLSKRRKAHGRT